MDTYLARKVNERNRLPVKEDVGIVVVVVGRKSGGTERMYPPLVLLSTPHINQESSGHRRQNTHANRSFTSASSTGLPLSDITSMSRNCSPRVPPSSSSLLSSSGFSNETALKTP